MASVPSYNSRVAQHNQNSLIQEPNLNIKYAKNNRRHPLLDKIDTACYLSLISNDTTNLISKYLRKEEKFLSKFRKIDSLNNSHISTVLREIILRTMSANREFLETPVPSREYNITQCVLRKIEREATAESHYAIHAFSILIFREAIHYNLFYEFRDNYINKFPNELRTTVLFETDIRTPLFLGGFEENVGLHVSYNTFEIFVILGKNRHPLITLDRIDYPLLKTIKNLLIPYFNKWSKNNEENIQ